MKLDAYLNEGMTMKQLTKHMFAVLGLSLLAGLLIIAGCSSSGQAVYDEEPAGDVENIDALLGLTSDSTDNTAATGEEKRSQDAIAEDDVLKLLGVTENKADAEQKTVTEKPRTTVRKNEAAVDTRVADTTTEQTVKAAEQNRTVEKTPPPPQTFPSNTRRGTFQERYQSALATAREEKDYRTAIQMFEELLSEDMTHSLSDNCQYWIGECYDSLGDYQQAAVAFEKVFTFYNSNKEADAQLKLGICYMRMKNWERARQELQKFIDNYPSHAKVSLARRYLEQMPQ